jgi:hypothetical protein
MLGASRGGEAALGFALPYLPQPDPQRWGGTRRAGAAAAVVVWRHILGFLARLQ